MAEQLLEKNEEQNDLSPIIHYFKEVGVIDTVKQIAQNSTSKNMKKAKYLLSQVCKHELHALSNAQCDDATIVKLSADIIETFTQYIAIRTVMHEWEMLLEKLKLVVSNKNCIALEHANNLINSVAYQEMIKKNYLSAAQLCNVAKLLWDIRAIGLEIGKDYKKENKKIREQVIGLWQLAAKARWPKPSGNYLHIPK